MSDDKELGDCTMEDGCTHKATGRWGADGSSIMAVRGHYTPTCDCCAARKQLESRKAVENLPELERRAVKENCSDD